MTFNGQDRSLQLNAARNDPRILLRALGCQCWFISRSAPKRSYPLIRSFYFRFSLLDAHGDISREWYFIMDFDVDYEDMKGVARPLPRAVYPGTQTPVLPTREGIVRQDK